MLFSSSFLCCVHGSITNIFRYRDDFVRFGYVACTQRFDPNSSRQTSDDFGSICGETGVYPYSGGPCRRMFFKVFGIQMEFALFVRTPPKLCLIAVPSGNRIFSVYNLFSDYKPNRRIDLVFIVKFVLSLF